MMTKCSDMHYAYAYYCNTTLCYASVLGVIPDAVLLIAVTDMLAFLKLQLLWRNYY